MSKTAFIDTNLAIAYVFFINSLHFKSKAAFDEYNWIYCSNSVEKEFKYRYENKLDNLSNFFMIFKNI